MSLPEISPDLRTPYQQRVTTFYTNRTDYDNTHTHDRAIRHLQHLPPAPGQAILDVATGTGFVAIAASEIVGHQGSVIGIDITTSYLAQAQAKIDQAPIQNIQLIEIDEADYKPDPNQFDRIYCSSAIVIFPNIPATLDLWYQWLKPGGAICFSAHSENSFFTPLIVQACRSQGVELPNLHQPLGTIERCHTMLTNAGFHNVEIDVVDFGKWLTIDEAKSCWNGRMWFHAEDPLPECNSTTLDAIKADFDQLVEQQATDQGLWHENLTFYISARKPNPIVNPEVVLISG
jgi:arsenite methyltransferase